VLNNNKSAKEYFRLEFMPDDCVRQLNSDLANEIVSFGTSSSFEFGCGQGKNLDLLQKMGVKQLYGIDLNPRAIAAGKAKGRNYIEVADELALQSIPDKSYEVCFTCGVLDHIQSEDNTAEFIIGQLKRIACKSVVLCETQDIRDPYYYVHYYEKYGFAKKQGYVYHSVKGSRGDGAHYEIWTWQQLSL
jgi:SAM-dependent methyltransferase